jgi:hypothetical protein
MEVRVTGNMRMSQLQYSQYSTVLEITVELEKERPLVLVWY